MEVGVAAVNGIQTGDWRAPDGDHPAAQPLGRAVSKDAADRGMGVVERSTGNVYLSPTLFVQTSVVT